MSTQLSDTVALLGDLIAFPTVSELSNLDMIAYLAHRLEQAGARVDIFHDEIGHKANLFATLGPETDGGIVLSGHSDVVPVAEQDWTSPPFEMIEHDGLLFGRGACDMKGFIAAAVAMAPQLCREACATGPCISPSPMTRKSAASARALSSTASGRRGSVRVSPLSANPRACGSSRVTRAATNTRPGSAGWPGTAPTPTGA